MQVGGIERMDGFFTKARYMRGVSSGELEQRLGYRTGRLADGWYLLFMMNKPTPADFEVRGYSQMSGGVPQGHLRNPPDPRNSEQRLLDQGFDLLKIKNNLIATTFQISGLDRLAKVIPIRPSYGTDDYPPGNGIPQWKLIRALQFKVAALVGPGQMYQGNYT